MNKTLLYSILFLGIGVAGYFGYKYSKDFHSKEKAIAYLVTIGKGSQVVFETYDEGYLIAFATAAKNGITKFRFGEKTFSTNTGKAI